MSEEYDLIIVGAGHAGTEAAARLLQGGFTGSIALLGAEVELPYDRPSLSKEYLSGQKSFDALLLRPEDFWSSGSIRILPGRTVTAIEPARHHVVSADNQVTHYGKLIWAAGGHPRRLSCPGADLNGVHVIRSKADVDGLRAQLRESSRVVIIGGGYIGLEAASVLVTRVQSVTLLETRDRLLARVTGTTISRHFESLHRANGVDVRLQTSVENIEGREGRVSRVCLADGTSIPADLVLVGIGMIPANEPLLAAGARGGDGVWVDEMCRTSLADIYAIGDCALHANTFACGDLVRLESVQNANDMAAVAATHVLGTPQPYTAVPRFWSDQYKLRLQTVGLPTYHDDAIVRGDPPSGTFSVIYMREEAVVALDCVNAPRDFMQGRHLVAGSHKVSREALQDVSRPLKPAASS